MLSEVIAMSQVIFGNMNIILIEKKKDIKFCNDYSIAIREVGKT
jgi:hypothetical protein